MRRWFSLGWLAESSLEQEDVGLGLVDHVVDPARALLHPKGSPLRLRHQLVFRNKLYQILGTNKRSDGGQGGLAINIGTLGRITCLYS